MPPKLIVAGLLLLTATASALAQVPVDQTAVEHFPNYHPLVVHFPIVLLCLAAVLQLGAFFVKNRGYHYTILGLALLGYATAYFAAAWRHPQIDREAVSALAQVVFDEHQLYARWSVWLGGAGAVLKSLELYFRKGYLLAILTSLALIGSAAAVVVSGHHGAELVHKHGIGPKGAFLKNPAGH